MGREARRNRLNRLEPTSSTPVRGAAPESAAAHTGAPRGKMSEKLKSVAEPWTSQLGHDPPESAMTAVYKIASTIWNASRLPDPADRTKSLFEIRRLMVATLPYLPPAAVEELMDEMCVRAQDRFGDDPRVIAEVFVERRDAGNFHVRVVSVDAK